MYSRTVWNTLCLPAGPSALVSHDLGNRNYSMHVRMTLRSKGLVLSSGLTQVKS